MALNPPLNQMGEPCRVEGELFVMKRKSVEFEFKVQNGSKYTGKGIVRIKKIYNLIIFKKKLKIDDFNNCKNCLFKSKKFSF